MFTSTLRHKAGVSEDACMHVLPGLSRTLMELMQVFLLSLEFTDRLVVCIRAEGYKTKCKMS